MIRIRRRPKELYDHLEIDARERIFCPSNCLTEGASESLELLVRRAKLLDVVQTQIN